MDNIFIISVFAAFIPASFLLIEFIRGRPHSTFKTCAFFGILLAGILSLVVLVASNIKSNRTTNIAKKEKRQADTKIEAMAITNALQQEEITELKKHVPKPFKERLLFVLNDINPNIITQMQINVFVFKEKVTPHQCTTLLALAADPEAQEGLFEVYPRISDYHDNYMKDYIVQFRFSHNIFSNK